MNNLTKLDINTQRQQFFLQDRGINQQTSPIQKEYNSAHLKPLIKDTLSFKGTTLKKSDFAGFDIYVIEKYKPNIQKFKDKNDLQIFAQNEILKLKDKDFSGRQQETTVQRKNMLEEWFNYVIKENDAYSNTQQLVILASITKELKPDNDAIPPVLNKGVLANTIVELETRLKNNPKENFDFNKVYQNNLRTAITNIVSAHKGFTGWVVIPSMKNDAKKFNKNVEKLKILSHPQWCTKSFNAEPYLQKGDIHIYLKNGMPVLCIRLDGDIVEEIQGEKNNNKIPSKYFDIFNEYQNEHKFNLSKRCKNNVEQAENTKIKIENIVKKLGNCTKLESIDDAVQLLKYFGIQSIKTPKGLEISHYNAFYEGLSFEDMGIDENKLFKYIYKINGDVSFQSSTATNLGNLEYIDGNVSFFFSEMETLGKLKEIKGNVFFGNSNIINTGKLEYIGGDAIFGGSKLRELSNIKTIAGKADFSYSIVTSIGNLEEIKGNTKFGLCPLKNTNKLKKIGGNADFRCSEIYSLDNLEYIGGNVYIAEAFNLKKESLDKTIINGIVDENTKPQIVLNNYSSILD